MPPLGTVDSLQPTDAAAPPNLREEMCGGHRKRPATEDEDEHIAAANIGPGSPYAVFLSSLRPKSKGGPLLQDGDAGEPVLVFTGTKPPAPGTATAATKHKPDKKKSAAAKPPAAKEAATSAAAAKPAAGRDAQPAAKPKTAGPGDAAAAKPKPKRPAPSTTTSAGAAAPAAGKDGSAAAKPKAATTAAGAGDARAVSSVRSGAMPIPAGAPSTP